MRNPTERSSNPNLRLDELSFETARQRMAAILTRYGNVIFDTPHPVTRRARTDDDSGTYRRPLPDTRRGLSGAGQGAAPDSRCAFHPPGSGERLSVSYPDPPAALVLATEAGLSSWLCHLRLRGVAPETPPAEEAVDLGEVRAAVARVRATVWRVVVVHQPLEVAGVCPRDLAERPTGEDAEGQDTSR
jgi:hypothetical protein